MTENETDGGTRRRKPKVARLIDEYDLDGMGRELERRWVGERGERESLRDLAVVFNRRYLQQVLERAGRSPLEGEVANLYRLLTDEDVSSGERTRARRELENEGVDVDEVTRNFVSHQAIHTYLRKYREVSGPSEDDEEKVRKDADTIRKMRNRLEAVTRRTLQNLVNTGRISLGSFTVFVEVRVTCSDCNTTYSVDELLSNGACECE
jgi:hypothetical protein